MGEIKSVEEVIKGAIDEAQRNGWHVQMLKIPSSVFAGVDIDEFEWDSVPFDPWDLSVIAVICDEGKRIDVSIHPLE
jgi:hypothetical protein